MQDSRRTFTADDLTDAYWRGYYAAMMDKGAKPIQRGWFMVAAVIACLIFWTGLAHMTIG